MSVIRPKTIMFKTLNNSTKITNSIKYRFTSSVASKPPKNETPSLITNRNPRNLERLRIGYKPDGFHVDALGKRFWHKLILTPSGKYVRASIYHFQNGEVINASTLEWSIKKQLYKTADTAAYINLGRVLAQRCIQAGIVEVDSCIEPNKPNDKVALFLKALEDGGVSLTEPEQYKVSRPWDQYRPEKPWEVTE